jgi:anti-anti-sigma factor
MPHSPSSPNGSNGSWDQAVPADFRVEVEQEREAVRVCPIGDLDLGTVEELRTQLEKFTSAGILILDLRGTTFLDSTGLRLAMDTHTTSTANGCEFAIFAGPPSVQRAFELTGLTAHLPFVDPPSQDGSAQPTDRNDRDAQNIAGQQPGRPS